MKYINKLFNIGGLGLFLLISVQSGMAQTRNVSWLHGLGENGASWNAMEAIFVAERTSFTNATSRSPGYDELNGVGTATNDIVNNNRIPNDPNSIVIGHSMGGVVARDIDLTNTGRMGGIISVGTPNNGAAISNSMANGDVDRAMTFACNAVLAGPSSEIPFVGIVIQSITPPIICEILSEAVVEPLLEDQNNQSAQDLAVGSGVITGLAGGTSGIPQISIWGNERSPVHWRLLSSLDTDNANDTRWVNRADDFRGVYNGFFIAHTSAAVASGIGGFFVPGLWAVAAKEGFSAAQWKRGVRWFDNSENHWNQLIDCGGDMSQEVQFTIQVPSDDYNCEQYLEQGGPYCLEYEACLDYWAEQCNQNPDDCWEEIIVSQFIVTNGNSDGFICEDSQIGPVAIDVYEARDANHSEEVVHGSVEERIRDLFDGVRGPNDFFVTN